MIEIITEKVEMPEYNKLRYKYNNLDVNGRKWQVVDTHTNEVVYIGKYEGSAIACHNLNKKFYRDSGRSL